jgi:hypothetical protein
MNYAEYLFSQLLSVYDDGFKNAPYDEQFYDAMRLYQDFMSSKFNQTNKSEYDSMCNYLSAGKHRNVKLVEEIVESLKQFDGINAEVWKSVSEKLGYAVQDKAVTPLSDAKDFNYTRELEHRLEMIADDSSDLREFIYSNGLLKKFSTPDEFENITSGEGGITFLNNIDIACDLNDDESLTWKLNKK